MARQMVGQVVLGIVLLSPGLHSASAAEVGATSPGSCPGYVAHLRRARAYLVHGDRRAAANELRQAEQALDSCARGGAGSNTVAGCSPSLAAI